MSDLGISLKRMQPPPEFQAQKRPSQSRVSQHSEAWEQQIFEMS